MYQLWPAEVGRAAVTLGQPSVNRAAHTELGLSKTQNTTKTQKQHQKQDTTNQKCFTLLCELIYLGFQSSLFEQTQLTVDPQLHYSGPLLLKVKDWDGMDVMDEKEGQISGWGANKKLYPKHL